MGVYAYAGGLQQLYSQNAIIRLKRLKRMSHFTEFRGKIFSKEQE